MVRVFAIVSVTASVATSVLTPACQRGCSPQHEQRARPAPSGPFPWKGSLSQQEPCPRFAPPRSTGRLQTEALHEASGLVASRTTPPVLWSINDSGDRARLFALHPSGRLVASFRVPGAEAFDWEALALAPDAGARGDALLIGDVGGNIEPRESVTIYRVPEPALGLEGTVEEQPLPAAQAFDLRYPDERTRDAEAMFVDPISEDLFLITKSASGQSEVYRAALPATPQAPAELELTATLWFGSTFVVGSERATDATISSSGTEIVIRTYTDAWLWQRQPGTSVPEALTREPCRIPLSPEPQGETIAFAADDSGYFTLSEGLNEPILWYEREAVSAR